MNRKFLIGVAIGALLAAAPIAYLSKERNAFEINPDQSSVVTLPDAKEASITPVEEYIYREDAGSPQTGLMRTDIAVPPILTADLTEDRIREIIREEIKANPGIVVDAVKAEASGVLNALNTYMAEQQANEEKNRDVKTLAAEPRLTKSEGYPYLGNPEGKVELFYYFDVNCGYCKQLEPELDRFVRDNPDVKVIHREMPILADSSRYAAELSGLLYDRHPERYAELHKRLMGLKPGMTPEAIDAALIGIIGADQALPIITATRNPTETAQAQDVAKRVAESLAAATEAGVTGTPFIIVKDSGLVLRGAAKDSYAQFQSMATKARAKHTEKAAR
ncbi:thioredoxin domain-containing protein [Agrobacterium rubi]|nr:thioredoxin domain-containing protein [Agrobacterium rubi]NTF24145.1 thioredoxin domain-containing protein [Agrobacterium rubi]